MRVRNLIFNEIRKKKAGLPSELPVIVYSEFLPRGVSRLRDLLQKQLTTSQGQPALYSLDQAKSRLITISGETTPKEAIMRSVRKKLEDPTSYDVLFISGAGA